MSNYKLMQMEPTTEMVEAAEDAYMPFGDMDLAIRMAVLTAPVVQGEPVAWYLPGEGGCDSQFRDHATVKSCTGNPWAGWQPLYTAPKPAEQQPDVAELVEALDLALEYWRDRQQRYKNRRPKWVVAAESALAAHRKGDQP